MVCCEWVSASMAKLNILCWCAVKQSLTHSHHVVISKCDILQQAQKLCSSTFVGLWPPTDLYQNLAIHCRVLWQAGWDGCTSNKLHSVKPSLGYCNLTHFDRRDAVILRRLMLSESQVAVVNHCTSGNSNTKGLFCPGKFDITDPVASMCMMASPALHASM